VPTGFQNFKPQTSNLKPTSVSKQLDEIQQILSSNASAGAIDSIRKFVPGQQRMYGVTTPVINEIVKKYKDGSFELAEELWNAGALEEKILAIKIIEKTGKKDAERVFTFFEKFSKEIDNWAVCDGLGMQFLRTVVQTHADRIFKLAKKLNRSKDPWQRRLSLVMVEWYTRKEERHDEIMELVNALQNDDEYYVRKAVQWIRRNFKKTK
jgi:3-methyladenine DNA glycosylase AlkD